MKYATIHKWSKNYTYYIVGSHKREEWVSSDGVREQKARAGMAGLGRQAGMRARLGGDKNKKMNKKMKAQSNKHTTTT